MTTTTMPWKAGRLVCRAPRLLRFGGCWCPAEGPGRHPLADLGRGRPVAVAHHGCSVWSLCNFTRSSDVLRQHQVFEIPVKRFDIGHLEFDGKEMIIDHKKHVEDFKFGIWWKPCRSKEDADIEWKWMRHYIGTRNLLNLPRMKASPWTCCVPQPAGSAATSKITWWRPDFHPSEKQVSLCMKRTHTFHGHMCLIGSMVQWSWWSWWSWLTLDLKGRFAFRCALIWMVSTLEPRAVGGLGWSRMSWLKLQIIRDPFGRSASLTQWLERFRIPPF